MVSTLGFDPSLGLKVVQFLMNHFRYDRHIDIGKRKRRRIHLKIFDTAGQEEMAALWEQHLKDKDTGELTYKF